MRLLYLFFGAGILLIAASFSPQFKDYRIEKSETYLDQGDLKAAQNWYFIGKLQGDKKAANNYHVLKYRSIRYDATASDKARRANRADSYRAFEKLANRGFVPAAYNAAMFSYQSKRQSPQYVAALNYLDFAAQNGDKLAADAAGLMRSKGLDKEAKNRALRETADRGNGYAAYKYADNLRFDKAKLKAAEKYAVMGAEAGYADAQAFLGMYFPGRKDAEDWLKKAATHPDYRNMRAPLELAEIARKRRKSKDRRKWLTLGVTPREAFRYKLVKSPDGLRWRGLQSSIDSGVNNDKHAAYLLAKMQMDGIGGPIDIAGAIKNLEYSDGWEDADLLLARLRAKGDFRNDKARAKAQANFDDAELKRFDSQKNYPFHSKLRPLMQNNYIRYATSDDLKKFANGVTKIYSHEKSGYKDWGSLDKCRLGRNCFYLNAPVVLPNDMFGAHSATFIVSPTVFLPKQHLSHNSYIFMSERNVPR